MGELTILNIGETLTIMSSAVQEIRDSSNKIRIWKNLPWISIHLACLFVFLTGASLCAVLICGGLYVVRMFGITAGYHRYFSHRTYKTSRFFQFLLALLGASAAQRGPLWWAAQHRLHHKHSDTEDDPHSPRQKGFLFSHLGWFLVPKHVKSRLDMVRDLAKYPELRFIDRFHAIVPITLAVMLFLIGLGLQYWVPSLEVTGFQLLVWGFFISTVLLYHGTYLINSLAHVIGSRRFKTEDDSRNNFVLAIITLGEGWHNNHHRYPASEPQGFYWWEVDVAHYGLKVLSWFGLVWDLKRPPRKIYDEAKQNKPGALPSEEAAVPTEGSLPPEELKAGV